MSIKNIFNTQIWMIIRERVLFDYLQGNCRIKKNLFKAIRKIIITNFIIPFNVFKYFEGLKNS